MTKTVKKSVAFLSAAVMFMAMLLYFPGGTFSNIDWGLKASAATAITPSQPTGDGSVGSPYQIGTAAELYWFAAQVNSGSTTINAVLKADITVNSGLLSSLVTDESGAVTNGETFRSWTPIGNSNYDYNGTFNGNGKTISGLFYDNSTTDYVGLFGYIDSGTVTGVKVVDSYFRGRNYVGGVCGRNNSGEVSNCGNSGKVVGTDYIGGVCGYNYVGISGCYNTGSVSGRKYVSGVCGNVNGEAINCYNTGDISGSGYRIGGVCGSTNSANAQITNCYNTGNVTSTTVEDNLHIGGVCGYLIGEMTGCYNTGSVITSGSYVGGVCGRVSGTVKNCYSLGDVSGSIDVGGVCGWTETDSKTVNCYSLGGVSGSSRVGGVCGYNCGALANCYFNSTEYTGEAIGDDSSGNLVNVSGKAAASFTSGEVAYLLAQGHTVDETVYDGSVWGQNIETETYPVLNGTKVYQNEMYVDCVDVSVGLKYIYANEAAEAVHVDHVYEKGKCQYCGKILSYAPQQDSEGVYQITNAAELYWFAGLVNGTLDGVTQDSTANAKLMNDITVNENLLASLEYDANGNVTNGESFTSWTPIGNLDYHYKGTFNGNGMTISGLFCNNSTTDYVGLFGCIDSGKVTDVKVADSYIRGKKYVGGVCGYNYYGEITNCGNSGKVVGTNYVGGVCGYNYSGEIIDSYNTGSVSGGDNVGGVCGYNYSGEMTDSYNTGSVRGGDNVGGVCGYNNGTIKNCYNLGDISGTTYVGGVCGITGVSSMTVNCYSLGGVSGSSNVGGVCGFNGGALANCYYLKGKATGGINIADVTGSAESKTIDEFNSGEVAYLLSKGCTANTNTYSGDVWGQDLSAENSYPVLGGAKVYQNLTYAGCEGKPGEPVQTEYSNTQLDPVYADHTDGDEDGKCDTCSKYMDNIGARLVGHSLTLDGSVGVNFYMELSSEVISDSSAYMEFTLPGGKTSTVKVSEAPTEVISGTTYYKFKCQVNATAMTDTITAQIKSTVGNSKVYEYTVKEYADYLFAHKDESTEFAEAAELIEAMVNYGSYAQIYAGYNTENLAVGDAKKLKSLDDVWINRYYEPSPYETKVQFAGANLSLLSTTTLRMYFKITDIDAESVLIGYQGQALEKTQSGDYYYVELVGIPASKLDDEFRIDVGDGSTNFVVTYTPMAYCTSVVTRPTTETRTEDLKNLIKALVLYNRAADAYISEN